MGEEEEESAAKKELEEAWKRRPNGGVGIWDTADSVYWLTIKDSEEQGNKLSDLTPHKAYAEIKIHLNPLKNGTFRNKDGSYNSKIPRVEVDLALKISDFSGLKVKIEKSLFLNRIRGTVYHPDIKIMPEEEISEALQGQGVTKIIKKK